MQSAQLAEDPTVFRLFNKAAFASARYPRLQVAFEKMVAASLESLREICGTPPQYTLTDVQPSTLGETLDFVGDDGMAAVFTVPRWDGRLVFAVNAGFVAAITDASFGGAGFEAPRAEKRKASLIEKNVVSAVLNAAAKALQSALSTSAPDLSIAFEQIESDTSLLKLDDRDSQTVVASFAVKALGRTGEMRIVFPLSTIQSARTRQGESNDRPDAPSGKWPRQMQDEIRSTDVKLRAVLEERQMMLADVAALRVGTVLPLEARLSSRIRLECNGEPLFLCEIGKSEGAYTLRVDQVLDRPGRKGE